MFSCPQHIASASFCCHHFPKMQFWSCKTAFAMLLILLLKSKLLRWSRSDPAPLHHPNHTPLGFSIPSVHLPCVLWFATAGLRARNGVLWVLVMNPSATSPVSSLGPQNSQYLLGGCLETTSMTLSEIRGLSGVLTTAGGPRDLRSTGKLGEEKG